MKKHSAQRATGTLGTSLRRVALLVGEISPARFFIVGNDFG
jgi:hypothetical protein